MKKKARSSKSKKSNRTSQTPSTRPPTVVANAKADSTPPSAPTLAAMEIAPRVDPDEISIPPVVPVVDLDDTFFSAPRAVTAHAGRAALVHDEDEPDPISQKMTPRVQARRERFSKYVKGTVAVAVAVCAMAMIRTSVGGSHKDSDPTPSAAAEPRAIPVLAAQPAAQPLAAPEPPKAAPVPLDVPPPPVAEVAAPVEIHLAEVAKPAAAPTPDAKPADPASTKTALEEKRTSRTMLERGKIAAAIESGERAVALDATDGEAWLILGAAYQEKGRTADARKAFTSCIQQGKKGPIGECRAMLR